MKNFDEISKVEADCIKQFGGYLSPQSSRLCTIWRKLQNNVQLNSVHFSNKPQSTAKNPV